MHCWNLFTCTLDRIDEGFITCVRYKCGVSRLPTYLLQELERERRQQGYNCGQCTLSAWLHMYVCECGPLIIIIIIIITTFKGTIRDFLQSSHSACNNNRIQRHYSRFYTISSQRRELSPTRTLKWPRRNRVQITCNTSSAYHVQHVVLRATWYEGTAQFDRVEIAFIWALFCWLNL